MKRALIVAAALGLLMQGVSVAQPEQEHGKPSGAPAGKPTEPPAARPAPSPGRPANAGAPQQPGPRPGGPQHPGRVPVGRRNLGPVPVGRSNPGRVPVGRSNLGPVPVGRSNLDRVPMGRSNLDRVPMGRSNLGRIPLGPGRRDLHTARRRPSGRCRRAEASSGIEGITNNRVHAPPFAYPRGWGYRQWSIGARLPPLFLAPPYFYPGWAALGLQAPPYGL